MSFDIVSPPGAFGSDDPSLLFFSRSIWVWRPLATYVTRLAPSLTSAIRKDGEPPSAGYLREGYTGWDTNDGFGLDKPTSKALAARLRSEIASGRAAQYVADRNARLASAARIPCDLCNATGIRPDALVFGSRERMEDRVITDPANLRFGQKGWCNACNGYGTKEDPETHYILELSDIQEFAEFLDKCKGFEIW